MMKRRSLRSSGCNDLFKRPYGQSEDPQQHFFRQDTRREIESLLAQVLRTAELERFVMPRGERPSVFALLGW